ncbi:helix-turn-helix transcriptional regulator [Clostridium sp. AM58-1XD]|uniref:helix-turn-helix domain-containing protein n=1 Tax=Clostridium sp. AM58-1XD TaxID=2292307 RepID=UPI000E5039D5|nr:helix-turn-helix transcriptional regulator [Clostridium sp. AM58-1XD]RGY95230.1 XRE family transcriptional regulator [Clostridium sp. AM58-1XD]
MPINFASRIKELRTSLGMTQSELAQALETTQAALSAYEKGDRMPSFEILNIIAHKYSVSIDWLCGLSNYKTIPPEVKTYADFMDLLFQLENSKLQFRSDLEFTDDKYGYKESYVCLGFNDPVIRLLFKTWEKTSSLYYDSTIDSTIYSAWKDKVKKDFNEPFLTIRKLQKYAELAQNNFIINEYEGILEKLREINHESYESPATE